MDYKSDPDLTYNVVQMFPYKSSFVLDRSKSRPLYLQLTNQFISFIVDGKLPSGTKLLGSRSLSKLLEVHRKTIVQCYEELQIQGWIEIKDRKGAFVHTELPILRTKSLSHQANLRSSGKGFEFYTNEELSVNAWEKKKDGWIYLDDGVSDPRLTPTKEIAMIYRRIATRSSIHKHLSYGSTFGNEALRKVLVRYLNETRGLGVNIDNILITRGSQMGLYLSSSLLIKQGDNIIVGDTNYITATMTFQHKGAKVISVQVDQDGIDTKQVELICQKHKIQAIYVTSHHHHPTTVTLTPERRMHLLNLAERYGFAIIEDDYDYDFNYSQAPILPLASHDCNKQVIYIGSVCKTVAPVFRVGYLIAPKEFVDEASRLRRYMDRQGDALLELTFAEFITSGDLDRHIRKVLRIYRRRRDLFCSLLKKELSDYFHFDVPKGGMAIWLKLNTKYRWSDVKKAAMKHKLVVPNKEKYDYFGIEHNCIRIGFAMFNDNEIHELIEKLKQTMIDVK